jgi:serine/threonine protein kinase
MTDGRIPNLTTVESPPRRDIGYEQLRVDDEELGTGGQGVVYRAHVQGEPDIDRIALKEPLDRGTLTGDAVAAFLREASTWMTIDRREREKPRWAESEHIVGIVDTGEELPWIAMEYMDGGSLASRLTDNPEGLQMDEALWIGESICRGVELAHNYGVAHLDLKPANVLFRNTGPDTWDVPKVADWGLARVLADETRTIDGVSIRYAAPEQFEPDEFGGPDMLTDVYQVGALVYALVPGRPPYDGSQASVMYDVVHGDDPPSPSELQDGLTESVDQAVLTALATEKRDRYDAIQVFKQALRAARLGRRQPQIVASKLSGDATARQPTAGAEGKHSETAQDTIADAMDTEAEQNASNAAGETQQESSEPETDDDGPEDRDISTAATGATSDVDREGATSENERGDATEDVESDRTTRRGWFNPYDYPEARDRSLTAGLRTIRSEDAADSIADGLRRLPDDSLELALERMHSDTH